jgi:phenylpropionate dioxygenase-like ring-hydroxylating dioxygenase large terminal subunit
LVRRRKPHGIERLGKSLVAWRDEAGEVVLQEDRCVHKGAKLSLGRAVDGCIECPYHGLRFDASGDCTLVQVDQSRSGAWVVGRFEYKTVQDQDKRILDTLPEGPLEPGEYTYGKPDKASILWLRKRKQLIQRSAGASTDDDG